MNHVATRKTINAIETQPEFFSNHEFGTAPLIDILGGRTVTSPMSLMSWVVAANGDRHELLRRLYDDQGSMEILSGTDLIYHMATTTANYACELLELEPLEKAVVTAVIWPESWHSEWGFICYSDRLMRDIPMVSPTAENAVSALHRMMARDDLNDNEQRFCVCDHDLNWQTFDQIFKSVLVEPGFDWTEAQYSASLEAENNNVE